MKAASDLVIIINEQEKVIVSYKDGDSTKGLKFVKIKKGEEIPDKYLKRFIDRNLEQIADVKYIDKVPVNLPKGLYIPPKVSKEMKIKKRKYSLESLTKIYNKDGFSALKEVGKEFGVTDRSYRRLMNEILTVQEERQRKGL